MTDTEPTREDAELALMAAVDDDRIDGLAGHELAIAMLTVLDDLGWQIVPKGLAYSEHDLRRTDAGGYEPVPWRDLAEQRAATLTELLGWRTLVADLGRNSNGRHEGDADVGDPTGVSHGNPLMPTGTVIGHSLGGSWQYVMPPRGERHLLDSWRRQRPQDGPA